MSTQQTKVNALTNAQQQLNAIVDALVAEEAFTEKMFELTQNLQTELDFELMLVEEWS
jgi:hypothetical protein